METTGDETKPSEEQTSHLPQRVRKSSGAYPSTALSDVKSRARPKTSTNREEAKQYDREGQEGEDFDPSCEIFFTSEIQINVTKEEKRINEFKILETIGKGAYSKVKHVLREFKEGDEIFEEDYAMKMMHKPTLIRERCAIYGHDGEFEMSNFLEKVYCEIEIHSLLPSHSNIVRLYEMIEAEGHDYLYLILEFCDLGQISKWDFKVETYYRNEKIVTFITEQHLKGKEFESEDQKIEEVAKVIFRDVLKGLEYLHASCVAHRDIKPDNIIINSKDGKAKISDFSVSTHCPDHEARGYNCEGTVAFTAPETHVPDENGFLILPTDIWSVGVTLYTFLSQIVPFYAQSELEIQLNAQKNDVPKLENYSDELNDIIQMMLTKDPTERPTASDLVDHPWLSEEVTE
ncbi:unnamed protein product [Moneuplotes crassus]|uniref:Protein kinase domain-containing protein n=2 Tax=Euplotes crassus TaxID=5936 RepID=A0AAD1ULK7_EUPCR|nr:unnamed protein product [Moneuplotes crassus]